MAVQQKPEVIKLGKKIKALIVAKDLKVYTVAIDAGLDPTNMRKYLRGEQEMKFTTLLRIASALDVTAGELINDLQKRKQD